MAADLRQNQCRHRRGTGRGSKPAAADGRAVSQTATERVQGQALAEHQITLNASDLLKEVAVYSDRADISEEIVRLRSHLDQFEKFVQADESRRRKLEFLTQEMFREINTIGSKANDVEISCAT